MYLTNITDNYIDTLSIYNKCTNHDNNFELIIPLIKIIPCTLSFICLISLMVYTSIKPLKKMKKLTIIRTFI